MSINKKKITVVLASALVCMALVFVACQSNNASGGGSGGNETIQDGRLLYNSWPFPVGVAVNARDINPANPQNALIKHFNAIVAENEMKPDSIMTGNYQYGVYNWDRADAMVNFAEQNGKKIRGHVLFWHSQTPAGFFRGSGTEGRATKDELYQRMETLTRDVFARYGNRVYSWDVINEVVDGGSPRNSPYLRIMEDAGLTGINRYEYVLKAFQFARKYADLNGGQNVELVLNEYNHESDGDKQNEFLRLLDYLIANDAPIDGVGLQMHIQFEWPNLEQVSNAIDKFSAKTRKDGKKLTTVVTELDITLFNWEETRPGGSRLTVLPNSVRNERAKMQEDRYVALFNMFERKFNENKLTGVLIWGTYDGMSWLNSSNVPGRTDYPLLFDRDYKAKPALNRLLK